MLTPVELQGPASSSKMRSVAQWALTHTSAPLSCAVVGGFALLFMLLLAVPQRTVVNVVFSDTIGPLDAAYRMLGGQTPHVDFQSLLGLLCFVLPYWGLRLTGEFGAAMPMAHVLFVAALTPVLLFVLASRLRPLIAIPTGLLVLALAASPSLIGEPADRLTMAMFYNRWGWSLICVLFLTSLLPASDRRACLWGDCLTWAFCIAALFYIKITFFVIGVAFLVLIAVVRPERRAMVAAAGVLVLATAFVVEALLPGVHAAYRDDLLMALSVRQDSLAPRLLKSVIWDASGLLVAILAVSHLAWMGLVDRREVLVLLLLLATGIAVISQNVQVSGIFSIVAVMAIVAELSCRAATRQPSDVLRVSAGLTFILFLSVTVQPVIDRSAGLALHTMYAAFTPADPKAPPALAGVVVVDDISASDVAKMLLNDKPPPIDRYRTETRREYQEVLDGADVLRRAGIGPQHRLIVFASYDPFQLMFDLKPPTGVAISSSHVVLNRDFFGSPEQYFGDADFILEERRGKGKNFVFLARVLAEMRPYLLTTYEMVDETDEWVLWRRQR